LSGSFNLIGFIIYLKTKKTSDASFSDSLLVINLNFFYFRVWFCLSVFVWEFLFVARLVKLNALVNSKE